jgi:hypothetical protein
MKSPLVVLLLFISFVNQSFSQTNTKKINFACNYFGRNISPQEICPQMQGFVSDSHAEEVIRRFAKKMGQVNSKFKVMQCSNTDNCFATVIEGQPFIIYDNAFLSRVEQTTRTDWGAVSILAHEIGHHANFHTIDGTGSRPEKELEADYFSGFWLHEMGANLSQSQEAMKHFQGEFVTTTHPPQSQRLSAIQKGWNEAENMHPRISTIPQRPQTKPIQPEVNNYPEPTRTEERRVIVTNDTRPSHRQGQVVERDIEMGRSTTTSTSVSRTGCVTGDCSNGSGVYVHPTQGSYKGSWRNGKRDGFGTHYYSNGQRMYVGEYVLGRRYGSGTFYFPNGERYEGRFIDDKPTDNGNYIMTRSEEREVVDLVYIYSDGRKEIVKVQNQDEEEEEEN